MLRRLAFSLLLAAAAAFAGDAAIAGNGIVHPGKHHASPGAAKHHFIPPGHRKHGNRHHDNRGYGYRGTRHSYGYRHYSPPVRIVRHSRVIYGHRHHADCGHYGYRPGYYSSYNRHYDNYYDRSYYRDYRRAGWRHRDDGFGFLIFYDY